MKKVLKFLIPGMDISNKIYVNYKISFWLNAKGLSIIAKMIKYKIYKKYNCLISYKAVIGEGTRFEHPLGVVIGDGAIIGKNCVIYQNVTIGRKNKKTSEYPIIGENVIVYCNSTIIGNVKIEDNAVIGCNSVVLRDVKEGETVYGIVK